MSASSLGGPTSSYAYLQSLLPPQSADGRKATGSANDPVSELLDAIYGATGQSGAPAARDTTGTATPSASAIAGPPYTPDMMTALMSAQEQQPGSADTPSNSDGVSTSLTTYADEWKGLSNSQSGSSGTGSDSGTGSNSDGVSASLITYADEWKLS